MIFAMLSCGCCSGILGYKRYSRDPGAWRDRKRGVVSLHQTRDDGLIVAVPAEIIPPAPPAGEMPGLQGHQSARVHDNPLRAGDPAAGVTIEMAGSYEPNQKIPLAVQE